MSNYEKTVKVLRALASKPRIQILECMQTGIFNPSQIAKSLRRSPSTVNQHLKVLLEANIIEKVSSSSEEGQAATYYAVRKNANELLARIKDLFESL